MKTHPARASSAFAFTLIELITVIAIIAVLMGLLFPHLASARDSARRQTAATVVRNVVNACNSYKQDYGFYPKVVAAKDSSSTDNPYMSFGESDAHCKSDNNALFDILRAISNDGENKDHALNPKQTKYYEGKKATDKNNPRDGFQDGSEFTSSKRGQLMDPWGKQYCFILETDSNEELNIGTYYSDLGKKEDVVRFGAVGICLGKDGILGGKGYEGKYRKEKSTEAPDDVVSWQ